MNQRLFLFCLATLSLPQLARCGDSPPAVAIFEESLGRAAPRSDPSPRLQVAIWPDGQIIWANDQAKGGPPFLSARIEPRKVQALLDRFEREHVFDSKSFRHSWFGPDSSFTTIWLQSGTRHTRLESWHEGFEQRPNLVALSTGVTSLNGTSREEALRKDTEEYQRFRRIWSDLRSSVSALVPKHGEPYKGSTALKLPK
jgi:hypothetical protein